MQNVPKEKKVLGIKNIRTFQQVSGEQGETSTILTFIKAAGQSVPPLVIHKGHGFRKHGILRPGEMKLAATEEDI